MVLLVGQLQCSPSGGLCGDTRPLLMFLQTCRRGASGCYAAIPSMAETKQDYECSLATSAASASYMLY